MQTAILTLIIPVISMIFTCAFFALWWNDRKQGPVLAFAICFGLLALGVVINIWIIEHADPFGIVAFHVVSMTGLIALMWGIAERADAKAPLLFSAVSAILVSAVLWLAVHFGESDAMRLAQNTNSAMITALIATTLWYGTKRNVADHILVWVMVALSAFGFIRPVLTILANSVSGGDGSGMVILSAVHVLVIASLLTLIALCLIASIVLGTMESERELATTDPLTGLANRGAFEQQVDQALDQARDENVTVSLLIGDIDHFKRVNDTWGHTAGDRVIATFGELIGTNIRRLDVAGRVGGEEFCILIWNCKEEGAVSLANRLRIAFSNAHISAVGSKERFTASFGVAEWEDGESYAQTFDRADKALYIAKRAGRDRVEAAAEPGSVTQSDASAEGEGGAEDHPSDEGRGAVVSFPKAATGQRRGQS